MAAVIKHHLVLMSLAGLALTGIAGFQGRDSGQVHLPAKLKVPVQLAVMSRCPDAVLCETVFGRVLQIHNVANKTDLSLVYIGNPDTSEPIFGVKCMHGSEECAANVQQLCVKKYMTFQVWWKFVQCQNSAGRENIGKPDLALRCAEKAGFEWVDPGVGACAGLDASGTAPEGVAMLQDSVKLSKDLGIQKSCTILIGGKRVCVHDGGWKDCKNGHKPEDFVKQIENEYGSPQ